MVRLGEVCQLINGDRGKNYPSQTDINSNGDIPFINAGHIVDGDIDLSDMNYISFKKYAQLNSGKIQKNDILYCLRGSLGKKAIVKNISTGVIASSLVIIRPNHKKINSEYLFYALESPTVQKQMIQANNGSSQPNLSAKSVSDYEFTLPNMETQHMIVDKLRVVNKLASLRQKQLSKLDELVKSRFIELFGLPNLNDKGWLKGVINDIGICVAGATPSTQVKEYWENGTIPWMSSGEVNKGRVFETDTKITQLGYDNASTKLVPPKTVVLAMAGQGKTRGTAAITEIELCTNQSICSIVNNEKVNSEYLLYFLKLQYMELRGASTNTDGRGGLNLKIIGNYPIMIPQIELQNKFAAFVEQTDKSKFEIQKSLEKLETLKKALMQKYFG